jgi:glycyl-tRNA synthetase (class II)
MLPKKAQSKEIEENKELMEVQKNESIKLVYIQILNKAQEFVGTLRVDAENFKFDTEVAELFKEYADKNADFISKLAKHISEM